MEKFVIIDGNSLINRAFYALPMLKSLSNKPCNAIFGFINMLLNVITNEKPKYLACVFDAGKHTFRNDLYQEYKGKRDKMPEDLASQLPVLKELLQAMGIAVLEKKEIEADDIIGSLTRKFEQNFILVSGDRDLLQLINNNTEVWLTQKGISNVLKVNESVLLKEFQLKPYQVIELKSIMGDSSDNIPGVMGIGKVGASKLIQQYDNLDNVYQHLDELPKNLKQKLIDHKDMAYLSKTLATIKLDVEIDEKLTDFEYSLPFKEKVYKLMSELDFKSILQRKDLFNFSQLPVEEKVNLDAKIIEIESNDDLEAMSENLPNSFAVFADQMTINFSFEEKEYILYKNSSVFNDNLEKIKKIFAGEKQKICFDAKLLMHDLSFYDIEVNNYFDVSMAIYIINEIDGDISVDEAFKMNNITTNTTAYGLIKLKEIYINKLINNLQLKLYNEIELPLVRVLFDMEMFGLKIDSNQIKSLSVTYHEELDNITKKIYELAGEEFNINSPKQLQTILFDKLNIEYKGKKGTSIEVLNAIANKHEIVGYLIRYRKISKLISTYLDGMLNYVKEDGKIHTTFMQRATSTGRLSSREPNLQNLPIRDDEGKLLRKMFYSSFEDGTLISADYNQIELRLIANFSQDENMIADYLSGKDIHTATASKIFNVSIDKVTPNMRRVAKSVNFGIIYGISAYGLSQNINSSTKEAAEFINKYMTIYPKVKEYGEECIRQAREKGYSSTIMGRVRHIPDINSSNHVMRGFAERIAKNMPLQGSASDIIKIAMIRVHKRLRDEKLHSKLVLQIHDELIIDCYPMESEAVKKILKEEMENVVKLQVPLLVEITEGKTLYDAK
ncbi:MAG TPA: DNA polymerase I [Candidatus Onthoplasma faecigallinarum]|nr:DNA polymerase I [Candidatus Onthoplasma faecigallinarum]